MESIFNKIEYIDGEWKVKDRKLKVFDLFCMQQDYLYYEALRDSTQTYRELSANWAKLYDLDTETMVEILWCVNANYDVYMKWEKEYIKQDKEDISK